MSGCQSSAVWFQNILFTDQDEREESLKSDGSEELCDTIEWRQLGFGWGRRRSWKKEGTPQNMGDPGQSCTAPRLPETVHARKDEAHIGSPIRSFNPYPARPGRLAAWKPESSYANQARQQDLSQEHHSTLDDSEFEEYVGCPGELEDPEARLARWLGVEAPLSPMSSATRTPLASHCYHHRRYTNVDEWDTDYSESIELDYLPESPHKSNASSISIEVLEELARCSCSNYFNGDFISNPHSENTGNNDGEDATETYSRIREGLNPVSCESPRQGFESTQSDVFSNSLRRTMKKDRLWEDIVGGLRRENDWLKQQMLGVQTTLDHTRKDLISAQEHLEKERIRNSELERDFKDKCRELVSVLLTNQRAREEEGSLDRGGSSSEAGGRSLRGYTARLKRLESENAVLRELLEGEDLVELQIKMASERWRNKRRQRNG